MRQSAALLDGRIITKAPKTKGSRRDVAMPDFVVAALRAHREQQEGRHRLLGIGNRLAEGVVFDRYDGSRWNPNELSRQFSRLVRRKKLPATRFHDGLEWTLTNQKPSTKAGQHQFYPDGQNLQTVQAFGSPSRKSRVNLLRIHIW